METMLSLVIVLLSAALCCLAAKLFLMRRDLKEVIAELREKLQTDTNTLIVTASSDRAVRRLAAELNAKLAELRARKLQLDCRSTELQNAVTNIAHDLRTPLTSISGYLELLEEEVPEGRASDHCGVIRERTDVLRALTEELFCYSVTESASDPPRKEPVVLNDELEIALAAAYRPLTNAGIVPDIRMPAAPVIRELDKHALQRVFGNVLQNAVKYAAGKLTVSLEADGTIVFSNPAPSLSEVEVGRLFDRFYTVENARGSTGLGLSIARTLTERMGGAIKADHTNGEFRITIRYE